MASGHLWQNSDIEKDHYYLFRCDKWLHCFLEAVVATIDSMFVWPSCQFQVALILLMSIIMPMLVSATMIACPDKTSGSISSISSSWVTWSSFLSCPSIWPCFFSAASQTIQWRVASKVSSKTKKGKTSNPSFWIVQLGLQEFAKTIDESEKCHHRVLYIQCHLVIEVLLCQDPSVMDQVCRG